MPSTKTRARLLALEETAAAVDLYRVGIAFVPALPNETDLEAIATRLRQPKNDEYVIQVYRRKGSGFEVVIYDQFLNNTNKPYIHKHPNYISGLPKLEADNHRIVWYYFHLKCCEIDGHSSYDDKLPLTWDCDLAH